MANKAKNVLSLDSEEAIDFFLNSEQYHGFELPEYFVFDELLQSVKKTIGDTPYEDCLKDGFSPDVLADVNLDILLNKDGSYAVRPIILANPFLYYFLVREICNVQSWKRIKEFFEKCQVPHITSCALPIIPQEIDRFHKMSVIFNWWTSMEQRSIELSLEYRYMFVTDITNCYGSVNPQVFDWAFSLKNTQYETHTECAISKNIQKYLRAFQQGRNIGIPQGSAIFDFLSEIILGYSDLLLHEAIQKEGITSQYEIIRYRDDYRIFCEKKDELEKISYILQRVLESLNFHMNSKKTKISDSIVTDSIKPDKLAYINKTPIFNKKGCDFDSFEKHLLYILMFAQQYTNSGSIKTMLADIDKRIEIWLNNKNNVDTSEWEDVELGIDDETEKPDNIFTKIKCYKKYLPGGSIRAMSAICTQIALENVSCCHYALRVLSRMVDSLDDEKEKNEIINLVYSKLCDQPNPDYNELWLQNITYQQDKMIGKSRYKMRLCRMVAEDKHVVLWNNEWLRPSFLSGIDISSIIDKETLKKVTPIITFRERRQYDNYLEEA